MNAAPTLRLAELNKDRTLDRLNWKLLIGIALAAGPSAIFWTAVRLMIAHVWK